MWRRCHPGEGIDPSGVRKEKRAEAMGQREAQRRADAGLPAADSFQAVTLEWMEQVHRFNVSAGHAERTLRVFGRTCSLVLMTTKLQPLSEERFLGTFSPPMHDVTKSAEEIVDIWAYAEAVFACDFAEQETTKLIGIDPSLGLSPPERGGFDARGDHGCHPASSAGQDVREVSRSALSGYLEWRSMKFAIRYCNS